MGYVIRNIIVLLFLIWSFCFLKGCGKHYSSTETTILIPSAQSLGGDALVISFNKDMTEIYGVTTEEVEVDLDNGEYDLVIILFKQNIPLSCFIRPLVLEGGIVEVIVELTIEACNDNYLGLHILPTNQGDPIDNQNN